MGSQPAREEKRYFLGVGGQQTGPFSENEIWEKVKSGEVPDTTPMWYEGLPDWQALNQVAPFNGAPPADTPKLTIKPKAQKKAADGEEVVPTFSETNHAEPVFGNEAVFSRRSLLEAYGKHMVVGTVVLLFGAAVYYIFMSGGEILDSIQKTATPKKAGPPPETRETRVRKALSELLLSPQSSTATLKSAWQENKEDEIGKQAFAALVEYYSNRSPVEAGNLYMESKQYDLAVKSFMTDPPSYENAARAYAQLAQTATEPEAQKKAMLEEITLLIGPANNRALAVEKLQAFDKKFPGTSHPFKYYLKPTDQKISDIFDRISFYFVQSLLAYLDTEFKQIKLESRPKIEIRKESDGKYRLVGSYAGDVQLNRDRLSKIRLVFWLIKEQWILVETNLTEERQRWAKGEKSKHQTASLSADEMLVLLETVFRTQFPRSALHERPSQVKAAQPE